MVNQMADSPKLIEVSAGLVFRDGRLLISKRRAQDHLGGLWEFPGGKRHDGESDEECLRRELREELDIEVTVGALIETITHEYSTKAVCLKFFRCVWLRNEPRAIGCQDFAWVTREELSRYTFPEADQRLLERLVEDDQLWL
jgi:8-oxo-dGTP diphosphatase